MSTGLTPNTREEMYLSAAAGETSTSDLPTPATRKEIYLNAIANNGGGGGGTSDYSQLSNKPKINNVELDGNKSLADIGAQPTIDGSHKLSADNVDDTSTTNKFATAAQLTQIETNKNNILSEQAKTTGMTEGGSNYITVGGIRVYVSATAPTGARTGDLWIGG